MRKKLTISLSWTVGVALTIAERGLDLMGYTNPVLGVVMIGVAACLVAVPIPFMIPSTWRMSGLRAHIAFLLFFCIAIVTSFTAGSVRSVPISDPEDARNKAVVLRSISPPLKGIGSHAILLEFRTRSMPSEGGFFALRLDLDWVYWENWQGLPARTDRQDYGWTRTPEEQKRLLDKEGEGLTFSPTVVSHYIGNMHRPIGPRNSEYFYIETNGMAHVEKADIDYIVVENNLQKPGAHRKKLSSQFEFIEE